MDDSDPNDKSFANFGDKGPRVKCWSSPLPHVENDEKFKREYSLQIVERCADPSTCFDGDKTLPVVSHMEGNLMVGTDAKDLDAKILKPNTDYVQLARFDFDAPTFNYASQLPEPIIFWVGGYSDIGNDDRTVSHPPERMGKTDSLSAKSESPKTLGMISTQSKLENYMDCQITTNPPTSTWGKALEGV